MGKDNSFHLTLYKACDHLFMVGIKLIHVSKRDPENEVVYALKAKYILG